MKGGIINLSSRLRHRVTLQQEVQSADGAGGTNKTWADVVDLWAEITPLTGAQTAASKGSGKEVLFADQLQAEISHRIVVRYRDGVTTAMRLAYESRIFNIRFVANNNEFGQQLELLVQEGVAT